MKQLDLLSLFNIISNLEINEIDQYLKIFGTSLKNGEKNDIHKFINKVINFENQKYGILDNYYLGYTIKQINAEFDLLRFGTEYIINIELKRAKDIESIKRQLKRNRYYLNITGKEIKSYTYESSTDKIYKLKQNEILEEIEISELIYDLENQKLDIIHDLDFLFEPSQYLVSPFNDTDYFLDGRYFLNDFQNKIKEEIIGLKNKYYSIEGQAGTGKTLLIYDIAKELIKKNKKVLIISCAFLNEGHDIFKAKGWHITHIKNYKQYDLNNYDLVIIDESQRIYKNQLEDILNSGKKLEVKFIFSFDKRQYIHNSEKNNDPMGYVITEYKNELKEYRLKNKIRSNKEIASFIQNLFDASKKDSTMEYKNIHIKYCSDYNQAKNMLEEMSNHGTKVINFTPSQYQTYPYVNFSVLGKQNVHEIIGQEFDNIAAVIDNEFYYAEGIVEGRYTKKLAYRTRCYYNPVQMLFQILTRTKKELTLIIVGNNEFFNEVIKILSYKKMLSEVKEILENKDVFNRIINVVEDEEIFSKVSGIIRNENILLPMRKIINNNKTIEEIKSGIEDEEIFNRVSDIIQDDRLFTELANIVGSKEVFDVIVKMVNNKEIFKEVRKKMPKTSSLSEEEALNEVSRIYNEAKNSEENSRLIKNKQSLEVKIAKSVKPFDQEMKQMFGS